MRSKLIFLVEFEEKTFSFAICFRICHGLHALFPCKIKTLSLFNILFDGSDDPLTNLYLKTAVKNKYQSRIEPFSLS